MLNRPPIPQDTFDDPALVLQLQQIHDQQDAELREKLMQFTALLMSEWSELIFSASWMGDLRQTLLDNRTLKECNTVQLGDRQYMKFSMRTDDPNEPDDMVLLAIFACYHLLGKELPDIEHLERAWEK